MRYQVQMQANSHRWDVTDTQTGTVVSTYPYDAKGRADDHADTLNRQA